MEIHNLSFIILAVLISLCINENPTCSISPYAALPKYGGAERDLWALYLGQKQLGHEVIFMTKSSNTHPDALTFDPSKKN